MIRAIVPLAFLEGNNGVAKPKLEELCLICWMFLDSFCSVYKHRFRINTLLLKFLWKLSSVTC